MRSFGGIRRDYVLPLEDSASLRNPMIEEEDERKQT